MTQDKPTIEGNKLIAEFMGFYLMEYSNYYHSNSDSGIIEHRGMHKDAMNYHDCWNELMPVVAKCKDCFNGLDLNVAYMLQEKPLFSLTIFANIETVWRFVVDFITWYNQQNPKQ